MTVLIDARSGAPIYDQICIQIRRQILSGAMVQDEALPSIRSLAKDLRISVITTKRAYDELESAGLIYTLPGKGSFVSHADAKLLRQEDLKQLRAKLAELGTLAERCGLCDEELWDMYKGVKRDGV